MPITVAATGSMLPERQLSNDEISTMVDTNDEWIRERTGIVSRAVATTESSLDLALGAAQRALKSAGAQPGEVGLVIAATITPQVIVPCLAARVRDALGIESAVAFDLNGACTGFLKALLTAQGMMEALSIDTALVVGAEVLSDIVDWTDRATCILFGDGAGAALVRRCKTGGILTTVLDGRTDTDGVLTCVTPLAKTPFSQREREGSPFIKMRGPAVFKFAVNAMSDAIQKVLEKAGRTIDEVRWIIPHQANARIIEFTARRIGVPLERFFVNVQRTGNTSAGSIPIALDELSRKGGIARGDLILCAAFGGGLSSGAMLMEWGN